MKLLTTNTKKDLKMFFRDSTTAFNDAIIAGKLDSKNDSIPTYAGRFMYMHSTLNEGEIQDHFKNVDTRKYYSFVSLKRKSYV